MEKLAFSGIILLMIGIILYSFDPLGLYSYLGLGDLREVLGEIGYYIFIVGIIVIIFHFVFRFIELYKMNKSNSDRNCSKCGRMIPFDECICPYCWKDFEENYNE